MIEPNIRKHNQVKNISEIANAKAKDNDLF
jgi:hypothetical protein